MQDFAIYGAGNYGYKLYTFLKKIGIQAKLFIQTTETTETHYKGVPLLSIEDYFEKALQYFIFIAIQDKQAVESIRKNFYEHRYDVNKIFFWSSFLNDNIIVEKVGQGDKYCNLCGRTFDSYLASGIDNEIFLKLHIIGGGYRKNALCPYCCCLDRTRWVYKILREKTNIFTSKCRVLHFAPEVMLRKKIEENKKCDYYAGDIELYGNNHQIDVTNIQFKNNFFDYIIINHVLEHVREEEKAFKELWRVLKPDGVLTLSFPITLKENTIEKENIYSKEDRLKYYGQEDHVRLYGRDYKKRIEKYGWNVDSYSPQYQTNESAINKYGFLKEDILLYCTKDRG